MSEKNGIFFSFSSYIKSDSQLNHDEFIYGSSKISSFNFSDVKDKALVGNCFKRIGGFNFLFLEGVVELWLTSEDTGAYGKDIGVRLPDLLWKIVEVIPPGCMMRIGMTNPPYIQEYLKVFLKNDTRIIYVSNSIENSPYIQEYLFE